MKESVIKFLIKKRILEDERNFVYWLHHPKAYMPEDRSTGLLDSHILINLIEEYHKENSKEL